MTWTLAAITSCYCLSVGPVYISSLLEIEAGIAYLLCFIIYWFQVKLPIQWAFRDFVTFTNYICFTSVHYQFYHLRWAE